MPNGITKDFKTKNNHKTIYLSFFIDLNSKT